MLTDINSLTTDELRSFSEFINSPYFNKSAAMKKLYIYLEERYPHVTKEDVAKDKIAAYLFDELKANDVRIRKIESEFNKLFEKFLIHHNADVMESHIQLLTTLKKKSLWKTYKKKLDEFGKYSEANFGFFATYYYNKLNYHDEQKTYAPQGTITRPGMEITYLNLYFVLRGLLLHLNRKVTTPPLGSMINSIYEFIENNKNYISKNHPDIIVFYYSNLYFDSNDIIYLNLLEKYFKKNKKIFNETLEAFYYQVVLNALHLNRSADPTQENLAKNFEFLKRLIRNGHLKMFYKDGRTIGPAQYFSCFNIAINVQAFGLAEKFAIEFNECLPTEFMDRMMNIVTLMLNFFRKDFTDVLERLNEVGKENTKLFVYSRCIKMMMLYELNDLQTLHYEIQAFTKYIGRLKETQTLPEREITRAKNFVHLIILLAGVKEGRISHKSKKFSELETRISSKTYVNEYQFWFGEKVREIEG